jgi:hypothetical protein
MIIQALEEESQLRYIDIQEIINMCCKHLALKKPSTETLTNHLRILCEKDVLHKEEGMYGINHYSLKYHHYITYVEKTLSLHKCYRFVKSIYIKSNYDQPVETIEEPSKDKHT